MDTSNAVAVTSSNANDALAQAVKAQALQAQIEALQAENAKLKAKRGQVKAGGLTMRVSEKGAVSVYGLGRFPVTLYREQWERLLAKGEDVKAFIAANANALKAKELTLGQLPVVEVAP